MVYGLRCGEMPKDPVSNSSMPLTKLSCRARFPRSYRGWTLILVDTPSVRNLADAVATILWAAVWTEELRMPPGSTDRRYSSRRCDSTVMVNDTL
jgi:hypothetical protein